MKNKIWMRFLLLGSLMTGPLAVISCNSVDGELTYKIVGLNADKTDYVVRVSVNKQWIAKIIEENNDNEIDTKIQEKILDKIKKVYPQVYKKGQFSNYRPSIQRISLTEYEVLFPIKQVITGLPTYKEVKDFFVKKYTKEQGLIDQREEFEDTIFMPDPKSIEDEFLQEKYIDKSNDKVQKKDYTNFNFLGIQPYMAGKLDDSILKNTLNLDYDVQTFLNQKFDGKKAGEQIKETVTLKEDFELTNFAGQEVDVYFHIKNIQERKPSRGTKDVEYQAKDKTAPFDKNKNDKADVYYSLFLKKELVAKNTSATTIEVSEENKIQKTSTKDIFVGLQKGTEISRVVDVDATKSRNKFSYNEANGITEEKLKNIVRAQLFTTEVVKDQEADSESLYHIKRTSQYQAIMTFDITKVETKQEGKWVEKDKNDVIAEGDRVTYKNHKIEYWGLPFENGEGINIKAYNSNSGFIEGFDKQMEGMTIRNQRTITPIFPDDYKLPEEETKEDETDKDESEEDENDEEKIAALRGNLVKFIIKVNDIKRRKVVDLDFLKENKIKNLEDEEMETMSDYHFNIENLFKAKIFNEMGNKYFSESSEPKVIAKFPYVLVNRVYARVYLEIYARTRRRPKNEKEFKAVLDAAKSRARTIAIISEFFKINQIQGDTTEQQRDQFTEQIYQQLP